MERYDLQVGLDQWFRSRIFGCMCWPNCLPSSSPSLIEFFHVLILSFAFTVNEAFSSPLQKTANILKRLDVKQNNFYLCLTYLFQKSYSFLPNETNKKTPNQLYVEQNLYHWELICTGSHGEYLWSQCYLFYQRLFFSWSSAGFTNCCWLKLGQGKIFLVCFLRYPQHTTSEL